MEKVTERLKQSIEKQSTIDAALENLAQVVRQRVEDNKHGAEAEVRRCYRIICDLTAERDTAIQRLIESRKIIQNIKNDLM